MVTPNAQAEALPAYHLRGLGLYEPHGEEILSSYQGAGHWLVPSGTEDQQALRGSRRRSPRAGSLRAGTSYRHYGYCSHHVAAQRVVRQSAIRDACGMRRWWSELT